MKSGLVVFFFIIFHKNDISLPRFRMDMIMLDLILQFLNQVKSCKEYFISHARQYSIHMDRVYESDKYEIEICPKNPLPGNKAERQHINCGNV